MTANGTFAVEDLVGIPRLSGLALSPDGARLVVSAAYSDAAGKKYVDALYELDPSGDGAPRRLTRSAPGESGAAFAPDGSLLFMSARPDPGVDDTKDEAREDKPALWLLPAERGEARMLAGPPGGVKAVAVSQEDGAYVFAADSHPNTDGWEGDAEREKLRKDAGIGAQLFTGYPIRLWDHYLGPRERHLYLGPRPEGEVPAEASKDLIPVPTRSLDMATFDLTPDARTVVTSRWRETEDPRERTLELVAIDTASGEQHVLAGGDAWYGSPTCGPDGRSVVAVRSGIPTPEEVADKTLWFVDLKTGEERDLLEGFDLWPQAPVWSRDSRAVFFTADEDGHTPVFRVDLDTGAVIRLSEGASFDSLQPAPDGQTVYALRSTVTEPPHPVALDACVAGGAEPRRLRGFEQLDKLALPARVERITAEASDGTPVRSWLLLPPGASFERPAPLATFIHGGPVNSWSGWHWRWNPNVLIDDGWAVLLPDPALSTGYGLDYIRRGWGRWGDVVYGDLMSAVDDVTGREEIDAERTVAMGGSFGGYMANWIAGHTNRFDALVTHASLWSLETFHGQTDLGVWWEREFGDPYAHPSHYREHSPHLHVENIETPMLVIHGELDYRVPIGEALALWTDLKRHQVPAKFLYFPDENHWVLKPNNARIWYETVVGFIDHYARGREWTRPGLL